MFSNKIQNLTDLLLDTEKTPFCSNGKDWLRQQYKMVTMHILLMMLLEKLSESGYAKRR